MILRQSAPNIPMLDALILICLMYWTNPRYSSRN